MYRTLGPGVRDSPPRKKPGSTTRLFLCPPTGLVHVPPPQHCHHPRTRHRRQGEADREMTDQHIQRRTTRKDQPTPEQHDDPRDFQLGLTHRLIAFSSHHTTIENPPPTPRTGSCFVTTHRPVRPGQTSSDASPEKVPAPTDPPFTGPLTHELSSPLETGREAADTGCGSRRAHTSSFPGAGLTRSASRMEKPGRRPAFSMPGQPRSSPETDATRPPRPQRRGPKRQRGPPRSHRSRHRSTSPPGPPALQPTTPASKPDLDALWSSGPCVVCAFVKRYGPVSRRTQSPRLRYPTHRSRPTHLLHSWANLHPRRAQRLPKRSSVSTTRPPQRAQNHSTDSDHATPPGTHPTMQSSTKNGSSCIIWSSSGLHPRRVIRGRRKSSTVTVAREPASENWGWIRAWLWCAGYLTMRVQLSLWPPASGRVGRAHRMMHEV